MFGSIRYVIEEILPRFGITSTIVDGTDLAAWRGAIAANTRMLFFETPSNPTLEIVDIAAVAKSHIRRARASSWTMPLRRRRCSGRWNSAPISWCIPRPKYIDGQGRALGGVILCHEDFLNDHLQIFLAQHRSLRSAPSMPGCI